MTGTTGYEPSPLSVLTPGWGLSFPPLQGLVTCRLFSSSSAESNAGEGGGNSNAFEDCVTEIGSRQGQNLALTVL